VIKWRRREEKVTHSELQQLSLFYVNSRHKVSTSFVPTTPISKEDTKEEIYEALQNVSLKKLQVLKLLEHNAIMHTG
jgi:hypothetical protein